MQTVQYQVFQEQVLSIRDDILKIYNNYLSQDNLTPFNYSIEKSVVSQDLLKIKDAIFSGVAQHVFKDNKLDVPLFRDIFRDYPQSAFIYLEQTHGSSSHQNLQEVYQYSVDYVKTTEKQLDNLKNEHKNFHLYQDKLVELKDAFSHTLQNNQSLMGEDLSTVEMVLNNKFPNQKLSDIKLSKPHFFSSKTNDFLWEKTQKIGLKNLETQLIARQSFLQDLNEQDKTIQKITLLADKELKAKDQYASLRQTLERQKNQLFSSKNSVFSFEQNAKTFTAQSFTYQFKGILFESNFKNLDENSFDNVELLIKTLRKHHPSIYKSVVTDTGLDKKLEDACAVYQTHTNLSFAKEKLALHAKDLLLNFNTLVDRLEVSPKKDIILSKQYAHFSTTYQHYVNSLMEDIKTIIDFKEHTDIKASVGLCDNIKENIHSYQLSYGQLPFELSSALKNSTKTVIQSLRENYNTTKSNGLKMN